LKELNKRICENVGRDARNLQIGHSYFMENGRVIKEFDKLCKVIHEDVIPLLEEYCYGDYTSIAKIIGEGLVDTSNQVIRHDLFNIARKSELISALLATCPDITTSSKVQTDEQEMDVDEENDEAAGDAEV
jgi:5-methylcytosine-specific restriction protein B